MPRARRANFDLAEAHKYFAAQCFNAAWDLIDKPDRTAADDRLMEALNQASIYHWRSRPDFSDKNTSVGYWQASRIQSLIGNWPQALRHAQTSLEASRELPPFLLGYAHEGMARALFGLGRDAEAKTHLDTAADLARQVTDKRDRQLLVADLELIRSGR